MAWVRRVMVLGGLALALVSLWLAPGALAAPPANDNFADAEVLGPGLPVSVTRTNAEATAESEEVAVSVFAARKSVWFEWEATSTGLVTIGTCDSDFSALIGVYTGTTVGSLAKVANGNADEGPHCPFSGREYTFKAVTSTSYRIAVDGNAFFFPESPQPATQGEFELRIESTPPPVNDDFSNALALQGRISEEPGGARSYLASASSHNWGATKEAGEPDHADDPGGASIWFSWTAPESGIAHMGGCCFPARSLGVYIGDSVDTLAPVAPAPQPPSGVRYAVSAGTNYRIAVDGKFDAGANSPAMGVIEALVFMYMPPLADGAWATTPSPPLSTPSVSLTSPNTTILKRKARLDNRHASFTFASSEPGSKFRCRLDGKPFAACKSPKTYKNLKPGRHTFKVVAVDAVGNADPTPAAATFNIPKPRAR